MNHRSQIESAVSRLIGLRLCQTRRATNIRVLHFGERRVEGHRNWGEWALHVSCPWRLFDQDGLVTGSEDLWSPFPSFDEAQERRWNYDADGNLQDHLLGRLLGGIPGKAGFLLNSRDDMVVQSIAVDGKADLTIALSGGFRLEVFPAGTREESWRVFSPDTDAPHFVIIGDTVDPPSGDGDEGGG